MLIKRINKHVFSLESHGKEIKTPFFFPSISSIRTNFKVTDYFDLIKRTGYPGFLISAYDVYQVEETDKLSKEISNLSETSKFVLVDSGHYETFWNNDKKWSFKKYDSILKNIKLDMCFSHDVFWEKDKKLKEHVSETVTNTAMTAGSLIQGEVIPIIHGTPDTFSSIIKGVIKGIEPQIIGITERELGASLLERASTLKKIRDEVDTIRENIVIHLLGTGNPASILIYTLCGANTFDALEWCKNVVNPNNGHLYHFTQKDLIECECKACKLVNVPYHISTMTHNLLFYETFVEEIRDSIGTKKESNLLKKYLPDHLIKKLKKILK